MEAVTDCIFLGSKIIVDGDCCHKIERCFLLGRKAMTNLDSILKSRDIALSTKVRISSVQFSSVAQSCPTLSNPWTAARQASLSITNSQSLFKLMSIESVMPSKHLILCCPLLLLLSIFSSIRVFSSECGVGGVVVVQLLSRI